MTASPPPVAPSLHADVARLAPLLGTWRGEGAGEYPTIDSFNYIEEVTFGHVGKPFLAYAQKTRHAETQMPMHAESGYWRPVGVEGIEVVLVHPTGILEAQSGSIATTDSGLVIEVTTTDVTMTPTAKRVDQVSRRFVVDGDELHYTVAMAAVGEPLTHHLEARLTRAS